MSSRKCQLKQRETTTTHLSEYEIQNNDTKCRQRCTAIGFSFIAGGNAKWCNYLEDWQLLRKLTIWSDKYALWYLPRRAEKLCLHKNLYTMLTVSLLITAKMPKQSRCPLLGEWINRDNCGQHNNGIITYSTLKLNELSRHEKTQKILKYVLLSERSQSGKDTYCMISTIWRFEKAKTTKTVKKKSLIVGVRWRGWRSIDRAKRTF